MTIGPGRQGKPSLWKLFVNHTKMISKQIFQWFYSIVENKICPFTPHLTNILRSNLRNAQQLHNCHKRKRDWGNDLKISKFNSKVNICKNLPEAQWRCVEQLQETCDGHILLGWTCSNVVKGHRIKHEHCSLNNEHEKITLDHLSTNPW